MFRRNNRFSELSESEQSAVEADGGILAHKLGLGPDVIEPAHRIVDLPPGALAGLLNAPIDRTTGAILDVKGTMGHTGPGIINPTYDGPFEPGPDTNRRPESADQMPVPGQEGQQ